MGTKATEYKNKFIEKAYDRVNLTMPKGQKETVRQFAESQGLSLNGYINKLIAENMNGHQSETQSAGADTLEVSEAVPTVPEREECENTLEEKSRYSDYDFKCSICGIDLAIDEFGVAESIFKAKFCPKCGRRIKQ